MDTAISAARLVSVPIKNSSFGQHKFLRRNDPATRARRLDRNAKNGSTPRASWTLPQHWPLVYRAWRHKLAVTSPEWRQPELILASWSCRQDNQQQHVWLQSYDYRTSSSGHFRRKSELLGLQQGPAHQNMHRGELTVDPRMFSWFF